MKQSKCLALFVCLTVFFVSACSKTELQKNGFKQEVNGIIIDMVQIPGGTFQMGSHSEEADEIEKPVHQVTLSSFYIGKYEVTQGQWEAIMGSNPSLFQKGDNYPVEQVSWDDAKKFILKLNKLTGKRYRMPTEAEWEYAARGGTTGDRYGDLNDIAWYQDNSEKSTHPIGQKQPNAYGLYDMLGNIWECCQDWQGPYTSSAQNNPTGPSAETDHRVYRGGSYTNGVKGVRTPNRGYCPPDIRGYNLGLRLAIDG